MLYSPVLLGVSSWRVLVRTGRSVKGAGRQGRTEKLCSVGKSEEMGFKARKKLITRKRLLSGAKDLRFICREFHKRGEELRNDRSANLSLVEICWRERHRWSEERVLLGGLISMSLWMYFGSVIWMRLCVMEIFLYWIRCSTLSQWRDLSTYEMGECFGSASNSMCKFILNMLKALNLGDG